MTLHCTAERSTQAHIRDGRRAPKTLCGKPARDNLRRIITQRFCRECQKKAEAWK